MRNAQLSTVLLILEKERCKIPWSQGASAGLFLLSSTKAGVVNHMPNYLITFTCKLYSTLLQITVFFSFPLWQVPCLAFGFFVSI
jgi:hypothetical protein